MKRITLTPFPKPRHIDEYPVGPCFNAGNLVTENASWRTLIPVINQSSCKKCQKCYLACPEGSVFINEGEFTIDEGFCKGCGICAKECPFGAITMEKEER